MRLAIQKKLFFAGLLLLLKGFQCSIDAQEVVAAYALNSKTGEVIVDRQGDLSLVPASCVKVLTTGAALHLLGPDHRFETLLEAQGELKEGVLLGNLVIRGGGDPSLGSNRMTGSLTLQQLLRAWVGNVKKLGILKVKGRVIGDDSRWEPSHRVPSWLVEDVGNYYGASASALSIHENQYVLYFKPGLKEGEDTHLIRVDPCSEKWHFKNEVKTGPVGSGDRAFIYYSEGPSTHYVKGTIPIGSTEFRIKGSILDPGLLCEELFQKELQKEAIEVQGEDLKGALRPWVIYKTLSPTVRAIIDETNQRSVNLYAEHLLKAIGEKKLGSGSTESGIQAMMQFWADQGIDLQGMHIVDGSGLSLKNFATPHHFVSVLARLKKLPHFDLFYHSLPERGKGVRAKSGSMSFIRCCVGYKGDIVFAIFINHGSNSQKMKEQIDAFIEQLP